MASLFGTPGVGNDNNTSNRIPATYSLGFLEQLATPLQLLAQGGNDASAATDLAAFAALRSVPNTTKDMLNSVTQPDDAPKAVPKPRDPRVRDLGAGITQTGALAGIAATFGNSPASGRLNSLSNLPIFSEPSPGIFSGRGVNALLQPQDIQTEVSAEGRIFGGPFTQEVPKRISQLNGFGFSVNQALYGVNPRAPGTPLRPIIDGNFYLKYGTSQGATNVGRINEFSGTATTPYPGLIGYNYLNQVWPNIPSGTAYYQTQNLALYVNNMPGRIVYLTRRKEPYYFHLPTLFESGVPPNPTINVPNLLLTAGVYFTTDPVGGGPWNDINIINGQAAPPPILPNAPYILYPGGTIQIVCDNTWPDVSYYQSTSGPFMGGTVLVVGSYNYI